MIPRTDAIGNTNWILNKWFIMHIKEQIRFIFTNAWAVRSSLAINIEAHPGKNGEHNTRDVNLQYIESHMSLKWNVHPNELESWVTYDQQEEVQAVKKRDFIAAFSLYFCCCIEFRSKWHSVNRIGSVWHHDRFEWVSSLDFLVYSSNDIRFALCYTNSYRSIADNSS
jgi:hypothetical protein